MENDSKWHLLQSRLREQRTAELFVTFRNAGIEPILIKGISIERFYPKNTPRPAVDIDIAVSPEDYFKAKRLHEDGSLGSFNVDIHSGLRHLDTREWPIIFERTHLIDIEGVEIRVLCPEDLLRVICIHWLTDGGERKDRLMDVYHIISQQLPDFNWSYCLDSNGPIRRRWVTAVIGLTIQEYPLDIKALPFYKELDDLPFWFVKTARDRWSDDVKFEPIENTFFKQGQFVKQLKRRFPPNAIMATAALGAPIDETTRFPIQVRYFFKRLIPSLMRSSKVFMYRFTRRK
jgi:hypothetical protein